MRNIFEFKHPIKKSSFWLSIGENENDTAFISVCHEIAYIFKKFFPQLFSRNYPLKQKDKCCSAYLPNGISEEQLHKIKNWCNSFGSQYVWPRMYSAPVCQFGAFSDLNVCISADMNFAYDNNGDFYPDGHRTTIGEAEYKLKYDHCANQGDWDTCFKILFDSLNSMLQLLIGNKSQQLFNSNSHVSVSNIPVSNGDRAGIAWQLAEHVAKVNNWEFIDSQLPVNKPKMKNLCLEDRVATWDVIYKDTPPDIKRKQIKNKTIVIIDDLYQSGVSMLAYAQYLRQYNPCSIYGLTCVKTRGDRDNT